MQKIALLLMMICLCLMGSQKAVSQIEKIFVQGGFMEFHGIKTAVNSFELSRYELTNEQFVAFLNDENISENGIYEGRLLINAKSKDLQIEYVGSKWRAKRGFENHPMVMVSYYGADACSRHFGGTLPTEAEWFYAAQGGVNSKHFVFAGSNSINEVGWYAANSDKHAHRVGEKLPNELGIYDMSGNAWEWCYNEKLTSDTGYCIHMGGSWYAGMQASQVDAHYGNQPTHFSNSVGFRVRFPVNGSFSQRNLLPGNYKGKPWNNQPQEIPGNIQCELYDFGGEGIAYHDNDSINNGSGKLNPANGTFLNEFRMHEGVDISYTKSKAIDDNPFNKVAPVMDQLYVGWTVPGEWINYTVNVTQTGTYNISLMYTASGDGKISFLLDGKSLTSDIRVPSTRNDNETIAWRQWHHWNRIEDIAICHLEKGIHVLTLQTVLNGNMNYDYIGFKLKN